MVTLHPMRDVIKTVPTLLTSTTLPPCFCNSDVTLSCSVSVDVPGTGERQGALVKCRASVRSGVM